MDNIVRTLVLLALTGYIASLIVGNPLHTNEEDDGSRSDQNTLPSFGGYDDDDDDDENEFRCVSNTPCSCSRRARKRSICVENLSARNVCVNGIPIGTLDLFQLPYSYRVSFPLFTRYLLVPFNGTFPGDIVVRGEIIARSVSTDEIDCVSGGPLNITCAEININTSPSKTLNVFGDTVLLGDLSVRDNIIVGSDGDNSITGSRSLIVGDSIAIPSNGTISFGSGNNCSADGSICGGMSNTISNDSLYSAVFGTGNSISVGAVSIVSGVDNSVNASISSIVSGGANSLDLSSQSILGGSGNRVTGSGQSLVCGLFNTVDVDANTYGSVFLSGTNSTSRASMANAIGFGLVSDTVSGTVVGTCNEPRNDSLLTVGVGITNGTTFLGELDCETYRNGLEVRTDGNTYVHGDLLVDGNEVIGARNSVNGSHSLTVGESMTVSSSRSISFGSGNQCSGDDSICGGVANSNTGIFTALFGTNNSASGLGGIIAGKGNQDNGAWGLTVGRDNIVSLVSGGNLVGGELNRIDCADCIVGGSSNTVNLVNRIGASLVSGIGSSINVPIASAIGFSLNSSTIGGTVVGSCNSPRSDALFMVGTGLIDYNPFGDPFCANNSNGLEVGTDGNTHVHGDLIVKGNTMSGSINTSALSINGTSVEPLSCHSEVNQIESELEGIGCIGNGFTCSTGTAIWGGCTLDPYAPLVVLQESGMLVVGGDTIQQCTWCNIFNTTATWNGSVSLLCCTGVNLISPPPIV